ncbi:putative AC transposase [Phytophthora citrophthora]|uniref:AC transposase n=1 Tax=Phytophthora citrophthora TaxID=4793 RepID=A0AAD9LDE4_9STRA|nr:putative AC transposase [Phytophthora citrophthora]
MERFHPNDLGTSRPIERNLNAEFADTVGNIREITKEEQEQVNRLLARWISAHFRPLLLVEDKGFIAFVTYITKTLGCVNVPLPKRTQLRRCIIIFANELREYVQGMISESCDYYSITADIWTAPNSRSYIAFTIHYVDEDFNPRNWTLEVKEIPGKHTGKLIADYLDIIMDDWKLDKGKCTRLVRDSGRNMVSAGKILGVEHFSCLAHDIHLVVAGALSKDKNTILTEEAAQWSSFEYEVEESVYDEDANLSMAELEEVEKLRKRASKEMDKYLNETLTNLQKGEMESIRDVVQKFRSLSVYFRKSSKGHNRLERIQTQNLDIPVQNALGMIIDCPTRWNSCLLMLQRCIKLEKALNVFFEYLGTVRGQNEFTDVHSKLTMPSHKDILTVKCLCTLLRPFTEVSKQLSGQMYPTLPLVLPSLCGLEKTLRNRWIFDKVIHPFRKESYANETRVEMQRCRETLLSLFTNRFDDRMISEPKWVAFLDPRIAGQMPHLRDDERQEAMDDLVAATAELAGDHLPVFPGETQTSDDDDDDFINQLLYGRKRRVRSNHNTTPIVAKCRRELKRYLAEVAIDSDESDESEPIKNPFDWWKGNQHKYRNLSRVARKWLGTVATSVASERAFSTSGNVVTAKRCSLAPDLVRDLVFIAENARRAEHYSEAV